jgi:hypothetical protein
MYDAFHERGAHALDAPVSGGPYGAEQVMVEAMTKGLGRKDPSAVWLLQKERAGVTVRT